MKRYFITFCLTALILVAGNSAYCDTGRNTGSEGIASAADSNVSSGPPAGVVKAIDLLLDYFRPVTALVKNVENGYVKIKPGSDINIRKGMRLSVYRDGEPFYHPVTNEVIGRNEMIVGRIEVQEKEVSDGVYLCKVIEGKIKSGDIARITSSSIKLAFFQDRKADWNISEVFFNSLKNSGRFEILESYTSSYKPEDLSQPAVKLGAEAVLMFSTYNKGGRKLLNMKLYWAGDAQMFGDVEEVVSNDIIEIQTSEEEFITTVFSETEPWGSYDIDAGLLMAMGDVDGNGARELVVSDGQNIKIYNLGKDINEIWSIKGGSVNKHLSLDILDVNNNGRAEIFVTTLVDGSDIDTGDTKKRSAGNKVKSFVIEYDPSKGYRKIEDNLPYFMRVSGKTLFMQAFASMSIFSGPVYEGRWLDGKYKPGKSLKLPAAANIYGFTFVDWQNRGRIYLMTFDDNGYLNLYNESGVLLWTSGKKYGIFPLSFKQKAYSVANPVTTWAIRGRLLSVKTERGQEVVVINKIPVISQVPGLGVRGAEVYSLWWNDGTMDEKLLLGDISGDIMDYWIEGDRLFLLAKKGLFASVKKAASGELPKGRTLYFYDVGDK